MKLADLRPVDDSAAEIVAALARIDAEHATTMQHVADLRAKRMELLDSDAPARDIVNCEAQVREAEIVAERLDDLRALIAPRLSPAVGVTIRDEIVLAAGAARDAAQVFHTWMVRDFPPLALAIRAGLEMERTALRAYTDAAELARAHVSSHDLAAAGGLPAGLFLGFPPSLGTFGTTVRLPPCGNAA